MMRKIISAVFTLAIISGVSAQGRVDGFYKGKGNLDLVLGGGTEVNSGFYAGNRPISLSRTINNVNVFIAYGITDKLDVNLSAPFVSTGSESALQDGAAYLKYRILEKSLDKGTLSFSMAAGISSNLTDYQTEGLSAIGQQATVIDFRPVVHYFMNNGYFATGQFGYRTKSDPTPNAIGAAFKVGKAGSKFYYDLWYEFQVSDGGLNYLGAERPTTFKQLGTDFHRIGGTFYMPIKEKLGFFVGLSSILDGRNVGNGYGVNGGIVLKR